MGYISVLPCLTLIVSEQVQRSLVVRDGNQGIKPVKDESLSHLTKQAT